MEKKGFTLLELLIVIAIIGVLATIIIINYSAAQAKARDNKRKVDLSAMQGSLELVYADEKQYIPKEVSASTDNPVSCITSGFLTGDSSDSTSWGCVENIYSKYISSLPLDPSNKQADGLYYVIYSSNPFDNYLIGAVMETKNGNLEDDILDFRGIEVFPRDEIEIGKEYFYYLLKE